MNKKLFALTSALLCTGLYTAPAQARLHIWLDDPFDMDWIDDMMEAHHSAVERMRSRFYDHGPSKEDREAIKAARKSLSAISHEIKEDDTKVTITFSGFENLTKEDVKVVKKGSGWQGTLATPVGRIEFFISSQGIQVTSRLEIKKEEMQDAPVKDKESLEEPKPVTSRVCYSSSSVTESRYFSSQVDVTTLKAEPVTPTSFVLTVEKQKEVVLPIS